MKILSSKEFADALNISERMARRHLQKGSYRGESLPIVSFSGQRGGEGGHARGIALDKCSPVLKAKLDASLPAIEGPLNDTLKGDLTPRQFDEQAERLAIIAPILKTEKRTAERAEAFRSVAAKMHVLRSKPATVAEKTLREWVLRHETNGSAALLQPQRADKGKARVLVTREWDAGMDLCDCSDF